MLRIHISYLYLCLNQVDASLFPKNFLAFIRPITNSLYTIYDPLGIKLFHRLQLGFSHLCEHKFKHNFADTVNPLCSYSLAIESTKYYFLRCYIYVTFCTTLMSELNSINSQFNTLEPDELVRTILNGDKNVNNDSNLKIFTVNVNFIKQTQGFEQALYWANKIPILDLTLWNRSRISSF